VYLVLQWSGDVDQPDISFHSTDEGTRIYTVTYDWFSPTFADKGTGPWRLVGYLALVLAEISENDGIALPLPR
jgi:hypothetical protein